MFGAIKNFFNSLGETQKPQPEIRRPDPLEVVSYEFYAGDACDLANAYFGIVIGDREYQLYPDDSYIHLLPKYDQQLFSGSAESFERHKKDYDEQVKQNFQKLLLPLSPLKSERGFNTQDLFNLLGGKRKDMRLLVSGCIDYGANSEWIDEDEVFDPEHIEKIKAIIIEVFNNEVDKMCELLTQDFMKSQIVFNYASYWTSDDPKKIRKVENDLALNRMAYDKGAGLDEEGNHLSEYACWREFPWFVNSPPPENPYTTHYVERRRGYTSW